ncbi:hypothetical protein FRB96_000785 [Tulasnella sp. 330]|nr:hypothetical protein FRB96_000785 [Tulasnella sp. 330]KAG8882526.1 hypothetical protein FRB97_008152 [Tulasnella sp. 331]KAG8888860.1 hypothetical protein FRB98_006646 [Tulasnella sp. 332]
MAPALKVTMSSSEASSNSSTPGQHYVQDLNEYVQKNSVTWSMDAEAIDKKRGEGWSATIFVDGKEYKSDGYFKKRADALESAAHKALRDLKK